MLTGILIENIKCLVQAGEIATKMKCGKEMSKLSTIKDAYLYLSDGLIRDYGEMGKHKISKILLENPGIKRINASGKFVFPSFCDSHTHLVYAGSREIEYTDKIRGLSYSDIAKRGGGILNSAKLLHDTSEEELYTQSMARINEIISLGTGAVEIKSGYGLNTEDELKMLRIIRRIKNTCQLEVKSTFMGAHSIPSEYKNSREKYVDLVINEMIPMVASENLADYIDVFCDTGFFTVEDTERILMAGMKYGLRAKIHANELGFSGGIQTAVKYDALSVDHLEFTGDEEIDTPTRISLFSWHELSSSQEDD
jgi:imidazolonepropionase